MKHTKWLKEKRHLPFCKYYSKKVMRNKQIQHLLRFDDWYDFADFSKWISSIYRKILYCYLMKKPYFYRICYTNLAESNSKIYLVKTVAKWVWSSAWRIHKSVIQSSPKLSPKNPANFPPCGFFSVKNSHSSKNITQVFPPCGVFAGNQKDKSRMSG